MGTYWLQKSYVQNCLYGETLNTKNVGQKLPEETTHDCTIAE